MPTIKNMFSSLIDFSKEISQEPHNGVTKFALRNLNNSNIDFIDFDKGLISVSDNNKKELEYKKNDVIFEVNFLSKNKFIQPKINIIDNINHSIQSFNSHKFDNSFNNAFLFSDKDNTELVLFYNSIFDVLNPNASISERNDFFYNNKKGFYPFNDLTNRELYLLDKKPINLNLSSYELASNKTFIDFNIKPYGSVLILTTEYVNEFIDFKHKRDSNTFQHFTLN